MGFLALINQPFDDFLGFVYEKAFNSYSLMNHNLHQKSTANLKQI